MAVGCAGPQQHTGDLLSIESDSRDLLAESICTLHLSRCSAQQVDGLCLIAVKKAALAYVQSQTSFHHEHVQVPV